MQNSVRPLTGFARAVVFLVLAAAVAAPAAAQFGGLKKKVKAAAGASETQEKAAQPAAPAGGGGTIVLTDDVMNRFITGLRAGKAEREAATKEDSPYRRHVRAESTYVAAKAKCDAAAQTYGQRIAADEKLAAKNNALLEKMIAAQQKQDTKLQQAYGDSLLAMQDPSCLAKQPQRPDNWFDLQREVDTRAEQQELKASGFDRQELGAVWERAGAILMDAAAPDVSSSEKDAVKKRADELKGLMGMQQVTAARTPKSAPAPVAPPPQPAAPTVSAEQSARMDCMTKNSQNHQKEMERLGERARVASEAGDMQTTMAIADSIRQLQMAGCNGK